MEPVHPEIHTCWTRMRELTMLGSRLIFLSNDLISFDKERLNEDVHNWLRLLMIHEGLTEEEGRDYLLEQHGKMLGEFLTTKSYLEERDYGDGRCIREAVNAVCHQLSGSVIWSAFVSKRYQG